MYYKNMPERLKSQVNSIFNKNERMATQIVDEKPVSAFDRSFSHKTTFDSGKLVPIFCEEVLPGDIWDIDVKTILRLGTPQAATMENAIFDINFYNVPNRVVWENFKALMGESKSAGFQEEITGVPKIVYDANVAYAEGDLASYLGFPMNISMQNTDVPISSLPFKAYIKIWNDFYRDENLQSEIDNTNNNNNDADVTTSSYVNADVNLKLQIGLGLASVSRLADYFSTCLPWPQKGDPITINNLSLSNILVTGDVVNDPNGTVSHMLFTDNNGNPLVGGMIDDRWPYVMGLSDQTDAEHAGSAILYNPNNVQMGDVSKDMMVNSNKGDLFQRLSFQNGALSYKTGGETQFNVNDLRLALAIQHMMELDARGGTRYIEILLNHFGVSSSDVRLQRAEYIGGWRDIVSIDNVVQSSAGTSASPLGVVGGVSVTTSTSPAKISYAAEEHGWIIGVITVRSNISYSQGLDKKFTRIEKTDFYDPLLANIGEQPVKKFELFLGRNNGDGTSTNNQVFGYNEAWSEYRWSKNYLSGYLSVNSKTSLANLYVYTEKYGSAPSLTGDWMSYDSDIIGNTQLLNGNASEFVHQFLGDFWFDVNVVRKMPVYGIPGLNKV